MESRKRVLMSLFAEQQWRHRHRKQTWGHSWERRGWDELGGQHWNKKLYHIKWTASGNLLYDTGSSNLLLCDNLKGWQVGGSFKREGTNVFLWLTHVDVWQKPTQYCKANYPPIKNKF